jgi:uncharacterized membrane-anchored protein
MRANGANGDNVRNVPAVTLGFWIAKVAATTLGETGSDTVTMSLNFGYLIAAAILFAILSILVLVQVRSSEFRPLLFWTAIVTSTMFGTAMADFVDRILGIGFSGGALLLLTSLAAIFCLWYALLGSVSVETVTSSAPESFFWMAVAVSQTLGTALGDWFASAKGFGYEESALVFSGALAVVAASYYWTSLSRVGLFWSAFILTRPLGATIGDFLDQPATDGGLELSRAIASALLAAFLLAYVFSRQKGGASKVRCSTVFEAAKLRRDGGMCVGDVVFSAPRRRRTL